VFGAIYGEAIGDAIGHPIENKWMGDATKEVSGLLKDNQFTDDTQMFCAIGEALLESPPHLGEEAFMTSLGKKFEEWRKAPLGGNHRAPGGNCMESVRKLGTGISWRESGGRDFKGNGTAMRSGIVGCMYWKNPEYAFRIGCLTSVCTHNNLEPILAAGTVAFLVAAQIAGRSYSQAVAEALVLCSKFNDSYLVPVYPTEVKLGFEYGDQNPWKLAGIFGAAYAFGEGQSFPILSVLKCLQGDVIVVNDGAAVPAVAEALFFNHRFESFEDIVINAANFADDSDTIAAISGTIAGARLGQEQIYSEWRQGIELSDYLQNLAERIYDISELVGSNRIHVDAVNMADPEVAEELMSGISITDDGDESAIGGDYFTDPNDDEEFEVEF
jgi:ADP-ribosylglycohydrolase